MGLTKNIMTRYPNTDGLISGTTTQINHKENLIPENGSMIPKRLRGGL